MRGENIILGVVGLTFLYISHLLQTSRLRLSWEGFQGTADAAKPAEPPKGSDLKLNEDYVIKLAQHVKTLCANSQEIDSIINGIKEIYAKDPSVVFMPGGGLMPVPLAPMPLAPKPPAPMPPSPKEGFQSHQNPYNEPSPNTQQAFEFRLSRRSFTN